MVTVNPYLMFPGNAEEAFNHYKSVFGTEIAFVQRFKDSPGSDNLQGNEGDKIMHIALPINKNNMLMASDEIESRPHKLVVGNNIHLSLNTDSQDEADRIFSGLSDGGKTIVPMSRQFWGAYFGMLTDKFGVHWMISFDEKQKPQA
jgi:PhnB protein